MGVSASMLEDFSVNIVPHHDIIPHIDRLEGLVQQISCASESAIDCHSIYRTTMELVRSCGDPRGRSFIGFNT